VVANRPTDDGAVLAKLDDHHAVDSIIRDPAVATALTAR
jgi:hypothetical protein